MKRAVAGAVVGAGAVLAIVALAAFRADGPLGHGRRGEMMTKFLEWRIDQKLDELKATPAQKEQVRAIEKGVLEQAKTLHEGNRSLRKDLIAELQADKPDRAKIDAMVDARLSSLKAFATSLTDAILKVHDILTHDQRQQLFESLHRHQKGA